MRSSLVGDDLDVNSEIFTGQCGDVKGGPLSTSAVRVGFLRVGFLRVGFLRVLGHDTVGRSGPHQTLACPVEVAATNNSGVKPRRQR